MARVGIMGGTFNPPHIGHQVCASEACDQLRLDRVVWVPAHTPPHKEVAAGAPSPEIRAELCEIADIVSTTRCIASPPLEAIPAAPSA